MSQQVAARAAALKKESNDCVIKGSDERSYLKIKKSHAYSLARQSNINLFKKREKKER